MTKPPWRPRASKIGDYLACIWRAANDRAIYEGIITEEQAKEIGEFTSGPNAPHGSVIHWTTQVGIGCVFPPRKPTPEEIEEVKVYFGDDVNATFEAFLRGDPNAYCPPPSDWAHALDLFHGNEEKRKKSVAAASQMLANKLPRPRDGKPWLAEVAVETDWITGHIDLLSQDHAEVGDIKTTAKPPEMGAYLKPGYLAQVIIYGRLTGAKSAFIEYVDSMDGRWNYHVDINLTTLDRIEYGKRIEDYCRLLMSDRLWEIAWPNIGAHCKDTWCPYNGSCAKKIFPAPGRHYDVGKALMPSGVISLGRPP